MNFTSLVFFLKIFVVFFLGGIKRGVSFQKWTHGLCGAPFIFPSGQAFWVFLMGCIKVYSGWVLAKRLFLLVSFFFVINLPPTTADDVTVSPMSPALHTVLSPRTPEQVLPAVYSPVALQNSPLGATALFRRQDMGAFG